MIMVVVGKCFGGLNHLRVLKFEPFGEVLGIRNKWIKFDSKLGIDVEADDPDFLDLVFDQSLDYLD